MRTTLRHLVSGLHFSGGVWGLTVQTRKRHTEGILAISQTDDIRAAGMVIHGASLTVSRAPPAMYFLYKRLLVGRCDKCGKLLATLIKKKRNKTYITGLRDTQGQPQKMPIRIAEVARNYFKNLYSKNLSTGSPQTTDAIQTYLADNLYTKLPETASEQAA
ncbi:Hypothetical predicted protein [Pelobates cultripes]|uniref:Uncharacterized protein n=1 Tax=Pelobates cultripes TaxID=61616 RepID=A0AAD1S7J6_PELCU|nr:Hypothetical predicted protein [Pelobates cultripes]